MRRSIVVLAIMLVVAGCRSSSTGPGELPSSLMREVLLWNYEDFGDLPIHILAPGEAYAEWNKLEEFGEFRVADLVLADGKGAQFRAGRNGGAFEIRKTCTPNFKKFAEAFDPPLGPSAFESRYNPQVFWDGEVLDCVGVGWD